MPFVRRSRGALLRLTRKRTLAAALGIGLAAPAAWVQFGMVDAPWWLEGLSLIIGATGVALFWAGAIGGRPDWTE